MSDSYHHGALREELVRAALAILEDGDEISLRGVARRAGVSHAAPYHHFADRQALMAAVAAAGLAKLREYLGGMLTPAMIARPERMVELGVAYVRFALENRALFRLMFSAELADRSQLPELQASFEESTRMLREIVGMASGETDTEEIRYLALRGWATVHGLANLFLDQQILGNPSDTEAERIVRRVLLSTVRAQTPA